MSRDEFIAAITRRFGMDDLSEILPAAEWIWENYVVSVEVPWEGAVTNEERASIREERLRSTDASVWTDEFMAVIDGGATVDWALMVAWFANAIETGRRVGHEQGYAAGMTAEAEALT